MSILILAIITLCCAGAFVVTLAIAADSRSYTCARTIRRINIVSVMSATLASIGFILCLCFAIFKRSVPTAKFEPSAPYELLASSNGYYCYFDDSQRMWHFIYADGETNHVVSAPASNVTMHRGESTYNYVVINRWEGIYKWFFLTYDHAVVHEYDIYINTP